MPCTGITHEQKIYVIACQIAEDIVKVNDEQAKRNAHHSLFVLSMLVTKEDHAKAKQLIRDHVTKCECDVCKAARDSVLAALNTLEGNDDSFSA